MARRIAHQEMANAIRALSIDAIEEANSGHPGLPLGMADVATVLFSEFLKFDASNPQWHDRDRFVLSGGHGSMLLYSLLYLLGYDDIKIEDLKKFRQLGSKTAGHPEYGHLKGIEDAIAAITFGALIVEKHFTINNDLPGRDNKFALLPHEMKTITNYRDIFVKMNIDNGLDVQECEMDIYNNYRGRWSKN